MMMQLKSRVLVDAMREDDIPEVQAIEREIFPTPWPRNAYYRELHHNRSAYYLVLRRDYTDNSEDGSVMWSDSIQAPSFKKRFKDILQTLDFEGLDNSTPQ